MLKLEKQIQDVAQHLYQQIQVGTEKWIMPWHNGIQEPYNPVTNKHFSGSNLIILWAEGNKRGYTSNKWATLRQWQKLGGKVRLGSKGVAIFRPHKVKQHYKDGSTKEHQYFRHYHVFNYEDINNLNFEHPDLFTNNDNRIVFNDIAEALAERSKADIQYDKSKAYYSPKENLIGMPPRESFFATKHSSASENFYATLLHELVHWTKHPTRLKRGVELENDQKQYAFEELVAELGASILCSRFHGLPYPREDHAQYLGEWLSVLQNNFQLFSQAALFAQNAINWLCEKASIAFEEGEWCIIDKETEKRRQPEYEDQLAVVANKVHHHWQEGNFNWLVRTELECGMCDYNFSTILEKYESRSYCPYCGTVNNFESVNQMLANRKLKKLNIQQ